MADIAHDASGPSPKPGDVAPQQPSRPDSPDKGKLRLFISYSRDDLEFADQLNAALNACGFECIIDREGISGGEDWKRRLGNLISEADTVVFVLSPTSARSEICAREVEEATRLGKRILPVVCRPLEDVSPPPRLRDLNYIFFHADPKAPGSGFGTGLAKLVAALNTDFDWLREHTRYLQRATEWDRGGRPANRLLSGDDIAEAKTWVARRPKNAPEPTALHLDFIRASEEEAEARSSAQRKQLEAMAAAQAERETSLHQAEEALKQTADAERKRARVRKIAFVIVSIAFVIVSILAALALNFYRSATQQRKVAEQQLELLVVQGEAEHADQIEWKDKAAAEKFSGTMVYLGVLYASGAGLPQNYTLARKLFEKAVAMDNPAAMNNLGQLYENGQGVAQDYGKAREWYEKAVAMDNPAAMNNLGQLYKNGQGMAQDYGKAREWYEKAAEKGDPDAMVRLGLLYKNGQGVAQDYGKACEWYQKAAAKGNDEATLILSSEEQPWICDRSSEGGR